MNVAMLSMFRNDSDRNLWHRLRHLTAKQDVTRWIWCTGNNDDDTEAQIRCFADIHDDKDITLVRFDSAELDSAPNERMLRLSESFNAALDQLTAQDDYILDHESDLESPVDVVTRFLATGKDVVGGWTLLGHFYYDTFATRGLDHQMFINGQKRPGEIFEVESIGSCWLAPARPFLDGIRCRYMGVLDLMSQMRARGLTVWLDPTIEIIQPIALWESAQHADRPIA